MADNSAALRRTRRHDSRIKRQRAAEAIGALEQTGEPISFPAVARRAGVSVSLLYTDPELAARIAAGRDRQQQAGHPRAWQLPARSLLTEQSLRAELSNTKEQVRQLTEEVALLRQRLAHKLGTDADIARGWETTPLLAPTHVGPGHHLDHLRGRWSFRKASYSSTTTPAVSTQGSPTEPPKKSTTST